MRFLIAAVLVLSSSLCLAEDSPKDPSEFKSLTVSQARAGIAMFTKPFLNLSGLTSIDKNVARELAKFKGESIDLNGLTSIDKDTAHELAKFEGDEIKLFGLTSIDKDTAHELTKFTGALSFCDFVLESGLTSMDKDTAMALARHEGSNPYGQDDQYHFYSKFPFCVLKSIDTELAQELAKFKGDLDLSGLSSIDKEVARELASYEGERLCFKLNSLDKDVAKELAMSKATALDVYSAPLDVDAVKELVKFQGKRTIPWKWQTEPALSLGLTSIDVDLARALSGFNGHLFLLALTSIDQESAHELAKSGPFFYLGLTTIDADVAFEFMNQTNCTDATLSLENLSSIDKDTAAVLAGDFRDFQEDLQGDLTDFQGGRLLEKMTVYLPKKVANDRIIAAILATSESPYEIKFSD